MNSPYPYPPQMPPQPQQPQQQWPAPMPQQQWPAQPPPMPGYPQQPGMMPPPPMQGFPPPAMPGYPPPGYGYPQQPGMAPPPPAAPPMPPPPATMPQFYMPDDASVAAQFQKQKEEQANWGSGNGPKMVKIPGPHGEDSWKSVPVGSENSVTLWLLPPVAPGAPISQEVKSHFWKSAKFPKGRGINCGNEGCLVCKARELGLAHSDENVQKRAKDFCRTRKKHLWETALTSAPQQHAYQDGSFKSLVLEAGATVNTALGDIINHLGGISRVVNPQKGRMLRLKKRKTGPQEIDIEYSVQQFDEGALPQAFWFLLDPASRWDLAKEAKPSTPEEQWQAVQDMGLAFLFAGQPMPQMPAAPQQMGFPGMMPPPPQTAAFMPQPPPAFPSPYGQPPQQGMPYGQPMPQQYLPQPQQPPQGFQQPPPMSPPPMTSAPAPGQQAFAPSAWNQPPAPPPPMSPPPVSSGMAPPNAYAPQVGQAPQPPAPPPPPMQQPQQQVQMQPIELRAPLHPGIRLPDGRERCFTRMNPGDRMCQGCPDWIRNQCGPQSQSQATQIPPSALTQQAPMQQPQPPAASAELAQLQAQLQGTAPKA